MRKYIPYIIILVFCIITIILLFVPTKTKNIRFLYYKKNYNLSSNINNNDYLNIEILINDKKSYFIDKKQIIHSYLTDKDLSSIIDLEIVDIISSDENIKYKGEMFYTYSLVFKVLFKTDTFTEWYIKGAKLMIGYNGNKNYSIDIGNFTLIKLEKQENYITIASVKPLLSKVGKNKYMTGLILGIRSTFNNEYFLKSIRILNEGIFVGNNISQLCEEPESNEFKEVLGYEYVNQKKGDGKINYLINENINYYVIPLYYENIIMANYFPIEFIIQNNHESFNYYFGNYKYYDQLDIVLEENDIIVYEIL